MITNMHRQKGDTIVEVLIAIAVVSLVLGGAYSIANRSLASVRQAQEHAEALKIAESQVEKLKTANDTGTAGVLTQTGTFCMIDNYNPPVDRLRTSAATYGNGQPRTECTTTNGIKYFTSITNTPNGAVHTYLVMVYWPNIHGNGYDQVTLDYNLDGT